MELRKGTTLKGVKYKIVKTLGQGSFGITYLAITRVSMDGQLGKLEVNVNVTIKEFFMSDFNIRSSDGTSVERTGSTIVHDYREKFRKEAENLAKLDHPNIVKVLEVFDENNTTYYVMEFIDGESVDEYIGRRGILPEDESLKITGAVCSALSYMHEHKMLHLDVKPKNMMCSSEGHVYLIDFGLSKQYDEHGNPESSTTLGLGTAGYAPIEQAHYKSDGSLPTTLDIYAVGASLYKMLTGKTPPESSYVLNEGLPLSPLKEAGVSDGTIGIVKKAMAPMKRDRYQSVKDMLLSIGQAPVCDEETIIPVEGTTNDDEVTAYQTGNSGSASGRKGGGQSPFVKYWKYVLVGMAILFLCIGLFSVWHRSSPDEPGYVDTTAVDTIASDIVGIVAHDREEPGEDDPSPSSMLPPIIENLVNNMVYVDGGTFTMGATSEQGSDAEEDEKPTHQVALSSFSIGKYEVMQEEWEAVMGSNPSEFNGKKLPVENVSWDDCQEFIRKLNQLTGKDFRLPTEAEWEYAACGGSKSRGYKYAGSNDIGSVAWYDSNSGSETHEVGQKQPNELGLYDMSGNVWEWCQDWYGDYSSSSQTNPHGPTSGSIRVSRGGGWGYYARLCRVSNRGSNTPDNRYFNLGLRLAQ